MQQSEQYELQSEDQRACSLYQYYTYTEQLEIKMNLVKEI